MRIIIYGANDMASAIATELFEDHDIIVIDPNQKNLDGFSKLDIGIICADILDIKILKEADIKEADVFIAVSGKDESNIMACLMVRQVSNAQTICFVNKKESMLSVNSLKDEYKSSYMHCIDFVIWPQKLFVQEIFQIITVPEAVDVENFSKGRARLLEYKVSQNLSIVNKKIIPTMNCLV